MKYLCLIYYDERELAGWPEAARDALWAEAESLALDLREGDALMGGEALQPTNEAVTLRSRHGTVSLTDGPFAETKEQLGGLALIDASNLDEAIRIAARVPAARFGSVEVRPVKATP